MRKKTWMSEDATCSAHKPNSDWAESYLHRAHSPRMHGRRRSAPKVRCATPDAFHSINGYVQVPCTWQHL